MTIKLRQSISLMLAVLFVLLAFAGCLGSHNQGLSHIDWDNHDTRAEQFVQTLLNGDFSIAAEGFDAEMQRALSVRALGNAWKGMVRGAGEFVAIEGTELEPHNEYDIYNVLTRHEISGLNTRIVFSADGLVAGLFFTFVENPEAN